MLRALICLVVAACSVQQAAAATVQSITVTQFTSSTSNSANAVASCSQGDSTIYRQDIYIAGQCNAMYTITGDGAVLDNQSFIYTIDTSVTPNTFSKIDYGSSLDCTGTISMTTAMGFNIGTTCALVPNSNTVSYSAFVSSTLPSTSNPNINNLAGMKISTTVASPSGVNPGPSAAVTVVSVALLPLATQCTPSSVPGSEVFEIDPKTGLFETYYNTYSQTYTVSSSLYGSMIDSCNNGAVTTNYYMDSGCSDIVSSYVSDANGAAIGPLFPDDPNFQESSKSFYTTSVTTDMTTNTQTVTSVQTLSPSTGSSKEGISVITTCSGGSVSMGPYGNQSPTGYYVTQYFAGCSSTPYQQVVQVAGVCNMGSMNYQNPSDPNGPLVTTQFLDLACTISSPTLPPVAYPTMAPTPPLPTMAPTGCPPTATMTTKSYYTTSAPARLGGFYSLSGYAQGGCSGTAMQTMSFVPSVTITLLAASSQNTAVNGMVSATQSLSSGCSGSNAYYSYSASPSSSTNLNVTQDTISSRTFYRPLGCQAGQVYNGCDNAASSQPSSNLTLSQGAVAGITLMVLILFACCGVGSFFAGRKLGGGGSSAAAGSSRDTIPPTANPAAATSTGEKSIGMAAKTDV